MISLSKFKKLNREAQSKLIDKVSQESDNIANSLKSDFKADDNQINALDVYTSITYQSINSDLRKGQKLNMRFQNIVKNIDNVITDNILKQDLIVYRGTGKEDDFNSKGFSSTSIDPYSAYNFARGEDSVLKKYILPKGTNYAFIGGGEKELLLPRDFDLQKYEVK